MATTLTTTSSATTSGVLPSLLDLLAPAATPAGGKSGAAFDALLQPPPARPVATDDQRRWQDSAESRSQQAESPRPLPPETREQELEPPHDEAANLDPVANDAVIAVEDDATNETEPKDNEQVVAESLAGLTMCVLPVPAAANDAEGAEEAPAVAIERSTGRRANRKGDVAVSQPGEAGAVAANAEGAAVQATDLVEKIAEQVVTKEGDAASTSSGTEGTSPVNVDQANATADATGEAAVADVALIQPVEPATEATPEQREGSSAREQLELAASAANQPAEATSSDNSAIATVETPVAAVAATPQVAPLAENVSSSSASSNTSGVQATGLGRRPRLPAELLAQDAGRAARNATTPVDATRLLTRVARAFAAAQQRDGEIQLRLSPPELGSLKLTLQMQDGRLVARLETETSAAKTAIVENLPALRERLAEQGVRIERFDVDLMQRQPGGMPDRPGDQQREAPQQRVEPNVRPRVEASAPIRGTTSVGGTAGGLNVIV